MFGPGSIYERRLLIVDDEPANVLLLEKILRRAGYSTVQGTTDPREVRALFGVFEPDMLLLDLNMPYLSGYEILEQVSQLAGRDRFFPVLVLTGDTAAEAKQRALSCGAKDFLAKPFDQTEVLLRIKNLLETQTLHLELRDQNLFLEERVRERTHDLEEARLEVLERLSRAAEFRDDDTGQHTLRVGRVAGLLAEALGLPAEQAELVRRAAPLHDVGKIGIPDAILLKRGKLTAGEFSIMATHTDIGARILRGSRSPLLQLAEEIALTHHESWNGSGYPRGLRGDAIPLSGQIVSVADVFDALIHERPYKQAWSIPAAIAEIQSLSGTKFGPHLVAAFEKVRSQGHLDTAL